MIDCFCHLEQTGPLKAFLGPWEKIKIGPMVRLHAFFLREQLYKEPTCRRPKYLKNLYY